MFYYFNPEDSTQHDGKKGLLGFDLICFDWPADRYHAKLARIALDFNLPQARDGFTFLENRLRTASAFTLKGLSSKVSSIYHLLEAAS